MNWHDDSVVVHVDTWRGDDDVIYQNDTTSSESSIPMHEPTPPPSSPTLSDPIFVPPPIQHRLETKPRPNESSKRSAYDMPRSNKKTPSEKALADLISSLSEPPKEDYAYAAGIITRTWLTKHPPETQLKCLVKLTAFIAEVDEVIMAENEKKN